jgi:hypothetical protein
MKKLLLTAAAILATLNMYGQGSGIINFANNGAADANRIWVGDMTTGTRAAGSAYQIALFWGNQGTPEAGLAQVGNPANFLTGTAAGQFVGGSRTLSPTTANGAVVTVQARAWSQIAGIPNNYDAVLAAGLAGDQRAQVGEGPVFDMKSKDPTNPLETAPQISAQAGWSGFAITPVPEPSVIGLGLLGVGTLLMLRRRK